MRCAAFAAGWLAAGTLFLTGGTALAQGPDGPPPPGEPGGPGGRRMGRGPMGAGPKRLTAVTVPVETLAAALGLSDDQTAKIGEIRKQFRDDVRSKMPRPGGPDGGGPNGPPDPSEMKARFEAVRSAETKANGEVEAVLNADQLKAFPDVLKSLRALGAAGVPPHLYAELDLTAAQRAKLAAVAPPEPKPDAGRPDRAAMQAQREKTRSAVMAILTAEQRGKVEAFRRDHPGRGRGPGGPGGPGGDFGGPGGDGPPPPPPGDGPDGPPPPDAR
jgi:hypothetical protein